MVSEYNRLSEQLDKLCEDNSLDVTIDKDDFPIRFAFCSEQWNNNQTVIDGLAEPAPTGIQVEFVFADALIVKMPENCSIDDELLTQLKNKVKKLHYLYLQIFFKQAKERERKYAEEYEMKGRADDE